VEAPTTGRQGPRRGEDGNQDQGVRSRNHTLARPDPSIIWTREPPDIRIGISWLVWTGRESLPSNTTICPTRLLRLLRHTPRMGLPARSSCHSRSVPSDAFLCNAPSRTSLDRSRATARCGTCHVLAEVIESRAVHEYCSRHRPRALVRMSRRARMGRLSSWQGCV